VFKTPTEAIGYSLTTSKKMVHRFVDDLKPEQFEYQPCSGANCVAWILGHLALTDRRSLTWLGVTDLPPLPPGFEERFKTTRTTAGDQKGYGEPVELVRVFDEHRDRLIAAVPKADPARFTEPPTFQTPLFSDRGEGLLFMGLHTAMHMGQLSVIRRSLGYPPLA
jgi:uncharacterized damage-inducible protein DinB